MKKLLTSALASAFALILLLTVPACNGDENPLTGNNVLHYDGPQFDSPQLPSGTYEVAMRLPVSTLGTAQGRTIEAVQLYGLTEPRSAEVRVYKGTDNNAPDEVVAVENLTLSWVENDWNLVEISESVQVDDRDLWVALRFSQNSRLQVIGCDAGPANDDGDYFFDQSVNEWQTFRNATTANINWNLRLILAD